MTIEDIYDDSDEIEYALRLMADTALERGDLDARYWLLEAATRIEGLYASAVALEQRAAKAGIA